VKVPHIGLPPNQAAKCSCQPRRDVQLGKIPPPPNSGHPNWAIELFFVWSGSEVIEGDIVPRGGGMIHHQNSNFGSESRLTMGEGSSVFFDPTGRGRVILTEVDDPKWSVQQRKTLREPRARAKVPW
jgi:hypothetical protein